MLTNKNICHEEIKCKFEAANLCYSDQTILSSQYVSKKKMKAI